MIKIINNDKGYWTTVVKDGVIVYENHTVSYKDILSILGIDYESVNYDGPEEGWDDFLSGFLNKKEIPEILVPNNFDEAVDYLVDQSIPVSDPYYDFLGGMAIRNSWGLWGNQTPIAKWFTERKLFHRDDRSGILIKAVEAKLKNQPFDIDKEIAFYQNWWMAEYGEKFSLENMEKQFFEFQVD